VLEDLVCCGGFVVLLRADGAVTVAIFLLISAVSLLLLLLLATADVWGCTAVSHKHQSDFLCVSVLSYVYTIQLAGQ